MTLCRLLAITAMFPVCVGVVSAAELSGRDEDYLNDRVRTLMVDVQAAQLASKKASTELVRAFAYRMVTDHGRALDNLRQLAAARKLQLPTAPPERESRKLEKIAGLTGTEFDVQFMKRAIQQHKAGIKADRKRMYGTEDAQLRALASQSHDTETAHLALANRALASIPAR